MTIKLNMCGHHNPHLADFIDLHLQVDINDPGLPGRLTDLLSQIIGNDADVVLVPPGFAPLASLTISAIHGLTGQFPRLLVLTRTPDGWVPGRIIDLQSIRDGARQARSGLITI